MSSNPIEPSDIFKCQQCGDCCLGFGGTFVTEKEIKTIAGYLNTDPGNFVENYCLISGGKPILAQGEDDYCIFWDGLCTIHPVKPRMDTGAYTSHDVPIVRINQNAFNKRPSATHIRTHRIYRTKRVPENTGTILTLSE